MAGSNNRFVLPLTPSCKTACRCDCAGRNAWPYLAMARLASEGYTVDCEGDTDGALSCLLGYLSGNGTSYISDWLEHDEHHITLWHYKGKYLFTAIEAERRSRMKRGGPASPGLPLFIEGARARVLVKNVYRLMDKAGVECVRYADYPVGFPAERRSRMKRGGPGVRLPDR